MTEEEMDTDPKQKDRILHLGFPSQQLLSAGLKDCEILLEYDKLKRKSSEKYKSNHPFDIEDIKDLPKAIHTPIAVFNSTSMNDDEKVILTQIQKDNNNFVVVIEAKEEPRKGGVILLVNNIETLYPKKARGIIKWILDDLHVRVDKEKALSWIKALQSHPETPIDSKELLDAANIINDPERTKYFEEKNADNTENSSVRTNQDNNLKQSDKHNNTLFIQLSRNRKYWNVNSAGIFKKKYSRNKQEIFTRPALGPGTNTDSSGVNSGRTEGVTAPAGNSPQDFTGKDTQKSPTDQTNSKQSVKRVFRPSHPAPPTLNPSVSLQNAPSATFTTTGTKKYRPHGKHGPI